MRTTVTRLPLALTALALAGGLLTACSTGSGALKPEDSPLSKYLMAASGGNLSQDQRARHEAEQQKKLEEIVAACMSKQGFEYKPLVSAPGTVQGSEGDWQPESGTWVQKYGYGVVHSPWLEQGEQSSKTENEDPNEKYVSSLSAPEQRAYNEALRGKEVVSSDHSEEDNGEWRWQDAGCQGKAQHEAGGQGIWEKDEFAGLRDRISGFWDRMSDAPELKGLDAKWAACMTEKGEPGFAKQGDAAQSIFDALDQLSATSGDSGVVNDPQKSEGLKDLGARELDLAKKDLDCREKTSYRAEQLKVQFALEEKFVAENRAELEAFKAAAEQQSK